MKVLSPVGTFPVRVTGARVSSSGVQLDAAMGAWRSTLTFDRDDAVIVVGAAGTLALAFGAGAWLSARSRR